MTTTALHNDVETKVLTPEASRFLTRLSSRFEARRRELLERAAVRQRQIDAGQLPDFLPETADIRAEEWTVAPIPRDLLDRRVEITGPVDRKMIINALNSGANVFMADFEDSNSPTWQNNVDGQVNLRDAVAATIELHQPRGQALQAEPRRSRRLMVRPRGWHLDEKHVLVDGEPISASLFDFGLYFFHNATAPDATRAPVRTSICPRWRAISKRACGTTFSTSRRTRWAFRAARSAPPC